MHYMDIHAIFAKINTCILYIFLKVFNATSRLGIYCGTKTPEAPTSPIDMLFIYFYSDGNIEGTGFNISFVEDYGNVF